MSWTDKYYTPFLELGKDIVRQSMPRPNPEATAGVPNPQRDDPYPRFDPYASERRAIGATAYGSVYGEEPRTAEELELASGVDRRIPDAPRTWGEPTRIPSLGAYALDNGGGYMIAHGEPPPVRKITPRVPFADAAGESLAATAARGARMQAEQDRLGLTTADMDYIRSYGRKAWEERNAKYGAPSSREDYLRRQQGNLAASVAARRAAENELSRIERDNEAQRRREMWALEQAQNLRLAEGSWQNAVDVQNARNAGIVAQAMAEGQARVDAASVPVSFGGGAGAIPDGHGGYSYQAPPPGVGAGAADNSWRTEVARIEQDTQLRVKELENQGLDRRQAQEIAARERIQKSQNEGNLAVAQAQAQGRTDAATATAQGRVDAATAQAEARVKAAGIRADAQKYASDNGYRAGVDASAARVEAAKAAGLSAQQVAQIRAESEERVAKLSQDGALARAGIQADVQRYIQDSRVASAADAAAAVILAAEAGAGAKIEAERIRAELQRELAAENPWTAVGGGVMGNRRTGETAGRPNAAGGDAKPQVFKMKGADGLEKLVRANADGTGAEVIFEDPDAAIAIAEQEVRNLESDRARYALLDEQREDYDRQIEAAKGRVAALKAAMKGAPEYKGPTGAPPTNDAAGGWAAFGGLVE